MKKQKKESNVYIDEQQLLSERMLMSTQDFSHKPINTPNSRTIYRTNTTNSIINHNGSTMTGGSR